MPRVQRWKMSPTKDGFMQINIISWKYYADFINSKMLNLRGYIFRGQARESWSLQSTFDRYITKAQKEKAFITEHLENFKFAVRGRRGNNPPLLDSENDWWALGQHNGLCTPLLDWTESPYVAAFFAYEEENVPPENRAIWAIQYDHIENAINKELIVSTVATNEKRSTLDFYRPLSNENQRLVNQSGLFSKGPIGKNIDDWVKEKCKGKYESVLVKIILPNKDREFCLKSLNRMNINHATLFPDLFGASKFCNIKLLVDAY